MTEKEALRRADILVRAGMDRDYRGDPRYRPSQQDPLAWWAGIELAMSLFWREAQR